MFSTVKIPRRPYGRPLLRKWDSSILLLSLVLSMIACGKDNRDTALVEQPIDFNHEIHTVKEALECSECHEFYATTPASGLPAIEVCAGCHTENHSESKEGKKVDAMADALTSITWVRMYRLPDHVVFNHSAHTGDSHVECSVCHIDTGISRHPTRFRNFGNTGRWIDFMQREKTMNWCIDCHEDRLASVDCLTCHQ